MNNPSDKIEAYLLRNLRPEDNKAFEQALESDQDLADEFAFQKNIVEGIRNYRKAQLKSRLALITIESPPFWQTAGFKMAGTAAVAVSLLIGVWLYNSTDDKAGITAKTVAEESPVYPDEPEVALPEIEKIEEVKVEKPATSPANQPAVVLSEVAKTPSSSSVKKPDFTPELVIPSDDTSPEEEEFETPAVGDEGTVPGLNMKDVKPLEIERSDTESKNLRYKYYDGKLSLYGKFEGNPYQILEINSKDKKRIFLYFNESYYFIKPDNQPQQLVRVENEQLIRELNILKEK